MEHVDRGCFQGINILLMIVLLIVLMDRKGGRFFNPVVELFEFWVFIDSLEEWLDGNFSHAFVLLCVDGE